MRTTVRAALLLFLVATAAWAQSQPIPRRVPRPGNPTFAAETSIKSAMQQFVEEKKALERDIEVLGLIRASEEALADPMQPSTALEKAHDRLGKAKTMNSEFVVEQGLIKALQEVDAARRSPGMTDFGRLRAVVRTEADGPSARLVARNALRLEEDILAWLKIQELIAQHLRALSEVTGESLRATQQ